MPVRRSKGRGQPKRGDGVGKVAGSKLSLEQQAAALAYAETCSDAQAAKRHGISVRTLTNYRNRLATDSALAELFRAKKSLVEDDWRDEALRTIREGAQTIRRLFALANQEAETLAVTGGAFPEGRLREVAGAWHLVAAELTAKDLTSDLGDPAGDAADDPPEGGAEDPRGPAGEEELPAATH